MRRLRALQEMAGEARTRAERRRDRDVARMKRMESRSEETLVLVDKIRQREAGAEGAKPMPYRRGDG